jgi:DNA-nicking Smr family endonuclease
MRSGKPGPPLPIDSVDEDFQAYAREMRDVVPLPESDRARVAPAAPGRRPLPPLDPDAEALAALQDLVSGIGRFDIGDTGEFVCGLGPGVDRRLLRRLRRGDYAVQGHLDLHGLRSEEARHRVCEFVSQSRSAGRRCVLIVHGRGLRSKDHIPVIKEKLVRWLASGRVGRHVLAFATARPHDGGAGAVYVLLRR